MGLAEELAQLADLRDRGILTEREFSRKKADLLRGKSSGLRWLVRATAVCIVALGSGGLAMFAVEATGHQLTCDSPEVTDTAIKAVNQQIDQVAGAFGILGNAVAGDHRIHRMSDVEQIYRNPETGFIACAAVSHSAEGTSEVGYTVSWNSHTADEFLVRIDEPSNLRERYGR